MPYHIEKGPYFAVAESVMNAGQAERIAILEMLRAGKPLTDYDELGYALNSTTLDAGPENTPQKRREHGEKDVLGGSYDSTGKFTPTSGSPTTGNFQNYSGNVELILRRTFIRAIEVSLGIDHGAPASRATRYWPLEYFWKCPVGWVEGWVTWQSDSGGNGHVSVHLLTPAHGHPVLSDPMGGRKPEKNPKKSSCAHGMWVITHEHHEKTIQLTTDNSEFAVWSFPMLGPVFKGTGDVITVSPSLADGGVPCDGLAYVKG